MDTKKTKDITKTLFAALPHLFGAAAFFIGRVVLFDTINPVIVGFTAALCFENCFLTAIFFSVLGLATIYSRIYVARYMIALAVLLMFTYIATLKHIKHSALNKSVLGGVSMLIGGFLFSVSEDITLVYIILAVLEGMLAGFECYIFDSGTRILFMKEQKQTLESEELLSLSLMICCVVSGSANINMGYTPLSIYLMLVFIFLLCSKCGFSLSISGSAIMGLVTVFGRISDASSLPVLIMGSIFATILSKKHKILTAAGFAMGAVPMAWYWQPALLTYGNLLALVLADLTLLFVPDKLYLALSAPLDTGIGRSLEYG
ncbi:MAG: hypothetical protein IJ736_05695, partial [Firmicutes bacterium]|nr:hypothetical protein [Bacillota bacterium]